MKKHTFYKSILFLFTTFMIFCLKVRFQHCKTISDLTERTETTIEFNVKTVITDKLEQPDSLGSSVNR